MLVDSHCHLDMIDGDVEDILADAEQHGVGILHTISVDIMKFDKIYEYTKYDSIYASVGQHPCYIEGISNEYFKLLMNYSHLDKVISIGESGLDYYHGRADKDSERKAQQRVFGEHIEVSRRVDKPIVVHSRSAEDDTFSMLKGADIRGVMHCFTGTIGFARKMMDLGFYISFSGILTFKNASDLREVCKYVPLDRMLIETDAPYLAPVPHRGKKNTPGYVYYVAECVASIHNETLESVSEITTANFQDLFSVK